jgi:predicted RND superfamily exporter protein
VFAVFRTPWVMLYGCAPLALAALLTLGINGVIQGSLSPATSGSAGMLFGLGIDGVVLLYLRYLEERRAGASPDDAVRHMGGTASSVVLAQVTTATTFFALLFIDFPTLQDLGSLVGLGILLCCGLTLLLLPALLPRRADARPGRLLTAAWLGRFVTRAAAPIVWVSAIATIALGAASTRLHLDTSIDKLQAQTRGAVLEKEVADRFSLPRDVLLVLNEHEEIEPLLETDARLERALAAEAPSVVTSGIGVLLPSAREQARVAQVIRATGTTSGDAQRDIQAAAARTGFRPDTFAPFLERVPRLLDPNERISYDGLMTHGLESIVSRFIVRRDGRYQAVTYLYPQQIVDIDALRRIVLDVDARLRLTGLSAINHELRRQFFPQFLKGIAIGTVAIALLIYLVFRTVRHTLLALLPTAVGFVWSAGALALLRVELDLFSLFAAVTFIGIGVDYGIYVLYRYVFEPSSSMDDVMTKTGAAIIIACATALIGFGTLINSSYGPLHVFGIVSIVTLTCCLTASIVSLPALVIEMERWSRSAR